MDIREEILKEHSKQQAIKVADWVGNDKKRLAKLMDIFLNDEEFHVVQRAARMVSRVQEEHPDIVMPYMDKMLKKMADSGMPRAVKRNVVRMLQTSEITEDLQGPVMNICFDLLADPKESVAVRAFSMTVLDNLSKIYPELRQELVTVLEDQLEQEVTAGFKNRAMKILRRK